MKADLHLHTYASDGALSPSEMIAEAVQAGADAAAVTDHDTVTGLDEALEAGKRLGVRVIPGVELSVGTGSEVHLLGYGVDAQGEKTRAFFANELRMRRERMLEMLEKLEKLGVHVEPEEVSGKGEFMGRLNLAEAISRRGYAASMREAFAKYLKEGAAAYVPRRRMTVTAGIEALCALGCVPVIAHPARSGFPPERLEALLPGWMEAGLAGIEAWHASHDGGDAPTFERMARKRGLLVTGGSDCHGRMQDKPGHREGKGFLGGHAWICENMDGWRSVREDVEALCTRIAEKRP